MFFCRTYGKQPKLLKMKISKMFRKGTADFTVTECSGSCGLVLGIWV